jgi:hypothetical protein
MKHSTQELLSIVDEFYPRNMWPEAPGYRETPQDLRLMEATRRAGTGVAYQTWQAMIERLSIVFPKRIHNTSLHLPAAWRSSCYEGICSLLKTEEAHHNIDFCVSFLAPYYLVYSWRYFREGRRFEVRFDLDEEEQIYGRKIADEIEATYGYEPMTPDVGSVLVAEIEIEGARYHYVGKGTINDYLFTINW